VLLASRKGGDAMSPSRPDVCGPWIQPSSEHDGGPVPRRPPHGGVEPSGGHAGHPMARRGREELSEDAGMEFAFFS
jgi:hypothetical protein